MWLCSGQNHDGHAHDNERSQSSMYLSNLIMPLAPDCGHSMHTHKSWPSVGRLADIALVKVNYAGLGNIMEIFVECSMYCIPKCVSFHGILSYTMSCILFTQYNGYYI